MTGWNRSSRHSPNVPKNECLIDASTLKCRTPIGKLRSRNLKSYDSIGIDGFTLAGEAKSITISANMVKPSLFASLPCSAAKMLTTTPSIVRSVHQTPLGPMASTWTTNGLHSLQWENVAGTNHDDSRAQMLDDRIGDFFQTGRADFGEIEIDTDGWTPFHREVYRCCREITAGTTITYKELAGRAGNSAASRAAGAAMARNRVLLVIPCHRVVSAGGVLRGFSAPGGLQTKQFLLDLESA